MQSTVRRIAVIGSGLSGGAAQIVDALRGSDTVVSAIFDSDARAQGRMVHGAPVLGGSDIGNIRDNFARGVFDAAVIGVGGNLFERERIFRELVEAGVSLVNVMDPTAQLRSGVKLGIGNVLLGGVYLGPDVVIGDNCYMVAYTSIQHDSRVGSHSYFSAAVALGGRIKVGDRVRFDIRSGARTGVQIGDDCFIGAGCMVERDLDAGSRAEAAKICVTVAEDRRG